MSRADWVYQAVLFRGWELVRLRYEITGNEVVVQEKHTWSGRTEKRVAISGLSTETRRVWSRQPAHWVTVVILLIVLMLLGYNLLMRPGGISGGVIDWQLWGPGMAVGGLAWLVMLGTRKRQEWTHFPASGAGTGLYVLKQRQNLAGHKAFVDAVKKRAN